MHREELPIGFAMALSMNPDAMVAFARLGEEEKERLIAGAHSLRSRDDMLRYVNAIAADRHTQTKG